MSTLAPSYHTTYASATVELWVWNRWYATNFALTSNNHHQDQFPPILEMCLGSSVALGKN